MNDRSATTRSAGAAEVVGGQAPHGGAAALVDPRVGRHLGHELSVADVDRDDLGGPVGQQHLGEPAGRGADVDAAPPSRRAGPAAPQCVERRDELVRGTADPARASLVTATLVARRRPGAPASSTRLPPTVTEPGEHQVAGLAARARQAAPHELGVEAADLSRRGRQARLERAVHRLAGLRAGHRGRRRGGGEVAQGGVDDDVAGLRAAGPDARRRARVAVLLGHAPAAGCRWPTARSDAGGRGGGRRAAVRVPGRTPSSRSGRGRVPGPRAVAAVAVFGASSRWSGGPSSPGPRGRGLRRRGGRRCRLRGRGLLRGGLLRGAFLAGPSSREPSWPAPSSPAPSWRGLLRGADAFFAGAFLAGPSSRDAFLAGAFSAGAAATRAGSPWRGRGRRGAGVPLRPVAQRAMSSTWAASPATVAAEGLHVAGQPVDVELGHRPTRPRGGRGGPGACGWSRAACSSSSASRSPAWRPSCATRRTRRGRRSRGRLLGAAAAELHRAPTRARPSPGWSAWPWVLLMPAARSAALPPTLPVRGCRDHALTPATRASTSAFAAPASRAACTAAHRLGEAAERRPRRAGSAEQRTQVGRDPGRPTVRWRLEAGPQVVDPGEHEQRVHPRGDGPLDVGVEPITDGEHPSGRQVEPLGTSRYSGGAGFPATRSGGLPTAVRPRRPANRCPVPRPGRWAGCRRCWWRPRWHRPDRIGRLGQVGRPSPPVRSPAARPPRVRAAAAAGSTGRTRPRQGGRDPGAPDGQHRAACRQPVGEQPGTGLRLVATASGAQARPSSRRCGGDVGR